MKKTFAISVLAIACSITSVLAQGQVGFSNNNTELVVMDSGAASALGASPWTPIPKGNPAAGDFFMAGLYYAPGPATERPAGDLTVMAHAVAFSRFAAGTWNGGNVTLNGVAYSSPVWLQVRVWELAYGSTFEQAINAAPINGRQAITGQSALWNMNVSAAGAPAPNIVDGGFKGFVVGIPEPSTIALGLLGLAGLFVVRGRQ